MELGVGGGTLRIFMQRKVIDRCSTGYVGMCDQVKIHEGLQAAVNRGAVNARLNLGDTGSN